MLSCKFASPANSNLRKFVTCAYSFLKFQTSFDFRHKLKPCAKWGKPTKHRYYLRKKYQHKTGESFSCNR